MTADPTSPPASPGALFADHLQQLHARVMRALEAERFDSLVVAAGQPPLAFLDDQPYPYRQNPHFTWWVPFEAPGSLLHVQGGRRPRLVFFSPEDYWHEPPVLPREPWVEQFDIVLAATPAQARAALGPVPHAAWIGEAAADRETLGVAGVNPPRLLVRLHEERTRKTAWELQQHRLANLRSAHGHRAAADAFLSGASEFEIHHAFLSASGSRESTLAYGAIVATGTRAATLHYQHLSRGAAGPSLLLDAGAQERGRASDVTRTHAREQGEFAALIRRMDDLQQSLCSAVRPGVDWRDLHLTAHQLLGELLRDAGLTRVDAAEAMDRGITRLFLPHGLGHLLGVQVHDVGGFQRSPDEPAIPPPDDHPHLRLTRVLEQGFLVTVEPGLYFIDSLLATAREDARAAAIDWARVDALRPWGGIRIEDDVAVTATGGENLTREAFARAGGEPGRRQR